MPSDSRHLEARLGHTWGNRDLLLQALTHRSFSPRNYERLEFLGDGVLNCVVGLMLYRQFPDQPEGRLSRLRANLVNQDSLHEIAQDLDLGPHLRLGEGELKSGGAQRPSILADALEAIIGAVYLDAGFAKAQSLVHRLFNAVEINPQMEAIGKDPKTELQEWLQGRKMKLPVYTVVGTIGAAHKQSFDVECEIPQLQLSERGIGGSRRAGEQAAAAAMLQTIKSRNPS